MSLYKSAMVVARGTVASVLFAIGWIALVVNSRPHVADVARDRNAIHQAIESVDTWSFTPSLLMRGEWGWYESPEQLAVYEAHPAEWLDETSARLGDVDEKIGRRLIASSVLTLVGVLGFWLGMLVFARAKNAATQLGPRAWGRGIVAGGAFVVTGPILPCLVVEGGPAGLLISGPPLVAGVVIALITLVSKRFATSS